MSRFGLAVCAILALAACVARAEEPFRLEITFVIAEAPRPMVKIFAEAPIADPVLTADELRALLQEPARVEDRGKEDRG